MNAACMLVIMGISNIMVGLWLESMTHMCSQRSAVGSENPAESFTLSQCRAAERPGGH